LAERGHIPSIFRHQSPHNTPTVSTLLKSIAIITSTNILNGVFNICVFSFVQYAILFGLLVILALLPFSFSIIIELANFSYCLRLVVQYDCIKTLL
jgi:hypothetical protein